jgi:PAS domain S-box-containing protein
MDAGSRQRITFSFRTLLATVAGGVVLVLGAAFGWIQYTQTALTIRRATAVELQQTLRRVDARVHQLLSAAEMTTQTGLRQTTARSLDASQLPHLFSQVVGAFEQRPELTFLGYAIDATGEYALLERRPDGAILLRLYVGQPGPERVVTDFRWLAGAFTKVAELRGNTYDPRTRPHYALARRAASGAWTDVYRFVRRFETDETSGITFAVPSNAADGRLSGVWDASLDLRSLHEFMRQMEVETGATPRLYTRRDRTLALLIDGSDTRRDSTRAALPVTRIDSLAAATSARPAESAGNTDAATLTDGAGTRQYASATVADGRLPGWVIAVTMPLTQVDSPLRTLGRWLLLATLGLLLMAWVLSRFLSRWLARPIEELGVAAEAMSLGAPMPTDRRKWRTREIASLAGSFERMVRAVDARETTLRSTNQRLQSHVDNTPLGVVEWDTQFRVQAWNPAAEAIFGWSAASMIGNVGDRLVPEDERLRVHDACSLILTSGRPGRFSFHHVTRTGQRIECEWYATATTDSDGRVTGVMALVLDVSQRLGAEEAFRQAEERFERLFRAAPAAIGISRVSDGRILDVNDAALAMFGYERNEVLDWPARDLTLWTNAVERSLVFERLKQGQGVYEQLAHLRARDGRVLTVLFSAMTIRLGDEVCSLWSCIDMTEREALAAQLQASQALKSAIVDVAMSAIICCDEDARIVEWNAAAATLLGWQRADVVGRRIEDVLILSDDAGSVSVDMRVGPDGDRSRRLFGGTELTATRRDGIDVAVEMTVLVTPVAQRDTFTIALRDISAHRQLARQRAEQQAALELNVAARTLELASSNQRLQDADTTKNRFLAMVSHELRTPLTAILGYAELLRTEREAPLAPVQRRNVGELHAAASELLRLINDLLDLSRVEAGRLQLRREPFRAADVLTAVERLLAPEVARKGLRYSTIVDKSLDGIGLRTDSHRLQQVVLNLAGNAVKFTTSGSVTVRATAAADGGAEIAVCDTGAGIPADQLEEVFQPFASLAPDASVTTPGAGLGLYLVRRLLILLGGEVTVTSVVGVGSTFTVRLPAESPAAAEGELQFSGTS